MLTAQIIEQVKRIQFHTGRQVADVLAGAYLSVFKGRGMEFDEVRPYVPGDDVRTIDWNVTGRMGVPYVKRYVEERQLTVLLMVDISASLDFGSRLRSKREAAVELSALLAFSAIHNDDKVGLLLFRGQAEDYIPPRKGQKHALRVVREVLARGQEESTAPDDPTATQRLRDLPRWVASRFLWLKSLTARSRTRSTNIAHALEFCRRVLPRKAVIFLISDFIDESYLDVLRSAHRKHDVVCVLVTDEREGTWGDAGLLTLQDAETGETALVDTQAPQTREAVARHAQARVEKLSRELASSGIDLVRIDATGSVVDPLLAFFRMRERRLRR